MRALLLEFQPVLPGKALPATSSSIAVCRKDSSLHDHHRDALSKYVGVLTNRYGTAVASTAQL